jgi:hypothetical protein
MIGGPNLVVVPHPQFLVATLPLLHLVLVQELTAWRAAPVVDILTVEVAMVIVLMTGHLITRLGWSLERKVSRLLRKCDASLGGTGGEEERRICAYHDTRHCDAG